uniref:E3 ubiquitin-protein ligase RNF170 n=1 Tax=Lepeophtheirus salmonis TaxID=72036 RepID=A0A0K2TDF5_LEPSM
MYGVGDECIMLFNVIGFFFIVYLLYVIYKYVARNASSNSSSPTSSPSSLMSNLNNRVRSESPECSICLESVRFAVETNCGHVFCGACLVEYVDRLATLSTPTCPYCRQRITMILLYFTPEESQDSLQDADRKLRNFLIEKIKSYNRSYSDEPRSILEQIRDFPILARRLWNMFWDYPDRTTLFFRIRVLIPNVITILYFLSPFDIIPEFLFGIFGLFDDIFIILCGGFYAVNLYRSLVAQRGLV